MLEKSITGQFLSLNYGLFCHRKLESMKIETEFKEAILAMPEKEKDKLLIRLIKKDKVLVNQLYFQLLETKSVEVFRTELEEKFQKIVTAVKNRFYSSDIYLQEVKEMSGMINELVSTTKDKYSEPYLNLKMLILSLSNLKEELNREMPNKSYAFNIYVIVRSFKILTQIKAMHEDLQYDFKEDVETLGELIASFPNIMKLSIYNGLDVNWLINFKIPEDIVVIQKDLRARGFLK